MAQAAHDGFGGTIHTLSPMYVSNLRPAIADARAFVSETIAMLKQTYKASGKREVA